MTDATRISASVPDDGATDADNDDGCSLPNMQPPGRNVSRMLAVRRRPAASWSAPKSAAHSGQGGDGAVRMRHSCDVSSSHRQAVDGDDIEDTSRRFGVLSQASDDEYIDDFSSDEDHIYENPEHIVTEVAQREKFRRHIVDELLKTERIYVDKLLFLKTIKGQLETVNSVMFMIPPEEVEKMFPHIEALYELHSKKVIRSLEFSLSSWAESSSIGLVFLGLMENFKLYEKFIKASPRAVKTFETWSAREQKFAKLLQMFQQNSAAKDIDVLDIFHEPYIKLQRWKLLLQRYQKYVPEKNRDVIDIPRVLHAFELILQNCEEALKQAERLETLLQLEEQIDGVIVFLSSDTQFLKDGPVAEVDPRSQKIVLLKKKETPLHLFLFNSFMLLCSPKHPTKKHTVRNKMQLSTIKLLPGDYMTAMGYPADRCVILQATKKAVALVFPTEAEGEEWKMLLQNACQSSRNRQSTKNTKETSCADFTCAPFWLPDDSASCCMLCCQDFSKLRLRTRHHCRACGIVICSSCSSGKLKLPFDSMKPSIVCKHCMTRARRYYPHLLVQPTSKTHCQDSPPTGTAGVDDDRSPLEQLSVTLTRSASAKNRPEDEDV